MALSKRLRFEILRRDNHTCRYCGASAPDVHLTVDHVLPVALGGADDPTNLVAACKDCNAGKSSSNPDRPLVDQVSDDAIRWAKAIEVAAIAAMVRQDEQREFVDDFDTGWSRWGFGDPRQAIPREAGWRTSIRNFCVRGMSMSMLMDAVDIAMDNQRVPVDDKWRYFMGVCWKKLTAMEEDAHEIIEQGWLQ